MQVLRFAIQVGLLTFEQADAGEASNEDRRLKVPFASFRELLA